MSDDVWECPECGWEYSTDRQGAIDQHKYQRHRLDDGLTYIERYRRVREEIPEKYHDAYDELTGSGRGIKSVQAAVCYIESSLTQAETADVWGTCDVAIRGIVNEFLDRGVVTLAEVRENNPSNGKQMFGEKRYQGEKSPNLHS